MDTGGIDMICSKYFVCKSPDKDTSKCASNRPLDLLKRDKMQSCFRVHWLIQNDHIREYNWNKITKKF